VSEHATEELVQATVAEARAVVGDLTSLLRRVGQARVYLFTEADAMAMDRAYEFLEIADGRVSLRTLDGNDES
jgi:hypothetical protein